MDVAQASMHFYIDETKAVGNHRTCYILSWDGHLHSCLHLQFSIQPALHHPFSHSSGFWLCKDSYTLSKSTPAVCITQLQSFT